MGRAGCNNETSHRQGDMEAEVDLGGGGGAQATPGRSSGGAARTTSRVE